MDESVKADLAVGAYLQWFHEMGIKGPWECIECGATIRKPRYLKMDGGKRRPTLTWCGQPCYDAWDTRMQGAKIPKTHWEKRDTDGILLGYVVPGKGFIPIDDERLYGGGE
jgi:hypothetical protein